MTKLFNTWVIAGTRAGQRNSCYGVAAKINPSYTVLKLREIEAAGSLEAYLKQKFNCELEEVPYPEIVISTGAVEDKTSPMMLELKKLSKDQTITVQINYPTRYLSTYFDIVVAERSADFRLVKNRLDITGVPHKITPVLLQMNAERPDMQVLREAINTDKPLFLAMIGGDINKDFQLSINEARIAGKRICDVVQAHGGQLLATNSPRISVEAWRVMRKELEPVASYIYDCREISIIVI